MVDADGTVTPPMVRMARELREAAMDAGIAEVVTTCNRLIDGYRLGYWRSGSAMQAERWPTRAADIATVVELHDHICCE